jgi:hypothetical protein
VMRGRQQRAWTWSGGCDGDGRRGGVHSAAPLLKRREAGEEGGGSGMGRGGCQVEEQGVRAASIGRVPVGRRASRGGGGESSVEWGSPGREREGARGPAQEKEKRAGPKVIVKILIYSNNFRTSLNCFDQKVELPSFKNFK